MGLETTEPQTTVMETWVSLPCSGDSVKTQQCEDSLASNMRLPVNPERPCPLSKS